MDQGIKYKVKTINFGGKYRKSLELRARQRVLRLDNKSIVHKRINDHWTSSELKTFVL